MLRQEPNGLYFTKPYIRLGQILNLRYNYDQIYIKEPIISNCNVVFEIYYRQVEFKNQQYNIEHLMEEFLNKRLNNEIEKLNFNQYQHLLAEKEHINLF